MKPENTISDLRLIDKSELRELLAWSDASIDRQVRTDPLFPQPLRLGQNSIRWPLEEVIRHINGLPRVCYEDHAFDPNSGAGSVKW